jgi:hypothetical protein
MRKRFSEKYAYSKTRDSFQIDSIDNRLKKRIWNRIREDIFEKINRNQLSSYFAYDSEHKMFVLLYDEFIGVDFKPSENIYDLQIQIKEYYDKLEWYKIYDFLEALVYFHYNQNKKEQFKTNINNTLEQEMSGYRFVDDCIAPIIDEVEIKEIEEVFESKYDTVKGHLSKALELLSDRENPDYQNSIKESISAVESIVNIVMGKANIALNKGLQSLPFEIDNNFKQGMIRLYSWTSSSDGIRHGAHEGEILSGFDEAKYMLVSCSAFINYLISKNKS